MPGKKRKVISDPETIAEYRKKLQRPLQFILSDEERKKYTFKSPFPQEFSLPSNILYYISRNPISKNGHLKFISTCKYLLRLSRILPVKKLAYNDRFVKDDDINKWRANSQVSFTLKDQFFILWIFEELHIDSVLLNLIPNLIKQVYKFSLRILEICDQVLTIGELKILVSGGLLESVEFEQNVVKNEDGSITEFENVFELLCCKKMGISLPDKQHGIDKNTTNKIIQILSSDEISVEQKIQLYNVPQDFDFSFFSDFLKTNITGRQHKINLSFSEEISDEYKYQLHEFVYDIIELCENFAYAVPIISFVGQDETLYEELWKLQFSLPSNIIYYVARNPKFPKGHLKLISSCKYVARISKILPVRRFYHYNHNGVNKWYADRVSINLSNKFFKLWIHDELIISPQSLTNLASVLINQIYKFSLRQMYVYYQDLLFEELQILVSGGTMERISFAGNIVKNSDGSIIETEKVFELLCSKEFFFSFPDKHHGIGKNTTKKIIEILSSERVPVASKIHLRNISQNFNFILFSDFLKSNMTARQHSFYLTFSGGIGDAYKNELQEFVNQIIQLRGIDAAQCVPFVLFPGQN